MKHNISTVSVPVPRLAQLKALAAVRNVALTDLIGQQVVDAMISGEIADVTPGAEVSVETDSRTGSQSVKIMLGGHPSVMSAGVARQVADALDAPRPAILALPIIALNVIGSDAFKVSLRGGAVALSSVRTEGTAVLAPQIARDLARQLRRAADRIAPAEERKPGESQLIDLDAI